MIPAMCTGDANPKPCGFSKPWFLNPDFNTVPLINPIIEKFRNECYNEK